MQTLAFCQKMEVVLRWHGSICKHNLLFPNKIEEYDHQKTLSLSSQQMLSWNQSSGNVALQFASGFSVAAIVHSGIFLQGKVQLTKKGAIVAEQVVQIKLFEKQKSECFHLQYKKDWAKIFFSLEEIRLVAQTSKATKVEYLNEPDLIDNLKWGVCRVSIPKGHKKGKIESPCLWKLEFKQKPSSHLMVLDIHSMPQEEFLQQMNASLKKASTKDLMLYIHGYQTSFADAARRAAQLFYDTEFAGIPVLYSWPSRANTLDYNSDVESVRLAEDRFLRFVTEICQQRQVRKLHVIAYSMGNRVLIEALKKLAMSKSKNSVKFGQIILTAADVNATLFEKDFPKIQNMATNFTLYSSSRDKALLVSQKISRFSRIGQVENRVPAFVFPGIDVIDVSALESNYFGHDYHASQSEIIGDIGELLKKEIGPKERKTKFYLRKKKDLAYYEMCPPSRSAKDMAYFSDMENYHVVKLYYGTDRVEREKE